MAVSEIVYIRHGQTEFNTRRIYQGQLDSPLTVEGIEQAELLRPRIAQLATAPTLYSSDLGRARHTAELIATPGYHKLAEEVGLRERNYGIFQGTGKSEIETKYPEEWARYQSSNPDYEIPGGESMRQFLERVLYAVNCLADRHEGQRIVAVAHGGTLAALAKHILGVPIDAPRRFDMGNTSLSFFMRSNGEWKIRTLGELAHLGDLPPPNQTEG
ncbi:MAG: histidine phosphatase family protein [Candidatus Latescibacterota bacterium]|nr:histidine phosphatase family protein [Candidatus Latescibacterota bacterium]